MGLINELIGAFIQLILMSLIPFVIWLITSRRKVRFTQWIGLIRPTCEHAVRITVISIMVYVTYTFATALAIHSLPSGITTAGSQFSGYGISAIPVALIYGFIRTGLSEEIFFRGFLLKRIQSRWGFNVGNLIQALLFGVMHGIPFGIVTKSIPTTFLLTILPGAIGWFQGWLNERKCNGSIVPSWLLHGTINFISTCLSL